VPINYAVNGKNLGFWVKTQRKEYCDKKISQERLYLLNELNFSWYPWNEIWFKKYNLLVEYKKEFGNIELPNSFLYKGLDLGIWSLYQRNHQNTLPQNRIKLLNEIGFIWNQNHRNYNSLWDNMYNLLIDYKKEFGDFKIPKKLVYKSKNLGEWTQDQKKAYKKNKLSEDRILKLNEIGFMQNINTKFELDISLSKYHLKNIIISNNKTREELAQQLNILVNLICPWVRNKKNIPSKHVSKIAEIFNIEPHLLQPQKGDGCVK